MSRRDARQDANIPVCNDASSKVPSLEEGRRDLQLFLSRKGKVTDASTGATFPAAVIFVQGADQR